jgi:hypothetical protein
MYIEFGKEGRGGDEQYKVRGAIVHKAGSKERLDGLVGVSGFSRLCLPPNGSNMAARQIQKGRQNNPLKI